eukprot:9818793-Alexandrium_andersonii.AAC.1
MVWAVLAKARDACLQQPASLAEVALGAQVLLTTKGGPEASAHARSSSPGRLVVARPGYLQSRP